MLLDYIIKNLDYALYATVPGAGGNDAIFILGNSENLHEQVQQDFCN